MYHINPLEIKLRQLIQIRYPKLEIIINTVNVILKMADLCLRHFRSKGFFKYYEEIFLLTICKLLVYTDKVIEFSESVIEYNLEFVTCH